MIKFDHHTQFTTITNLNWFPLLQKEQHKQIVIEALQNRVERGLVTIYAFVIMPNHMHLLWQLHDQVARPDFQRDFLKFTARSLIHFMKFNDDPMYEGLRVSAADRQYQVWERNSLNIAICSEKIFIQKLNYIHRNPLQPRWNLCESSCDYKYSSAKFYETGINDFGILTHFRE